MSKEAPARKLTAAERLIALWPFSEAISFESVRILSRWHTPAARFFRAVVVRGDRIFWPNAPREAATVPERALLAHELVHVWQYKALGKNGLQLLASRRYRYSLSPGKAFLDYGYEQQASIVEDFVRLREGLPARHSDEAATREAYLAVFATVPGALGAG